MSRFLFTRGLFLMLMEFTVVRLGWTFDLGANSFVTQVIWAIGASMVVLSGLDLSAAAGHRRDRSRDDRRPQPPGRDRGRAVRLRRLDVDLLHEPKLLRLYGDTTLFALYPLIPWVGVMATGYALGPLFALDRAIRVRWLVGLGVCATAGFVLLRAMNVYGDPAPWRPQENALSTVLSFVNCEKYPPSLLYLLMTLGPGLLLLAAFEKARGRMALWLVAFGRVPLFFHVAHLFLIHGLAVSFALATKADASWLFGGLPGGKPADWGLGLPGVYVATLLAVLILYPLCRWFARLKQNRTEWWWSYL